MDTAISNVCNLHEDVHRAIDEALWLNDKTKGIENILFSVIEGPENNYAVVSSDVLDMFENPSIQKLYDNYTHLSFQTINWIRQDPNPLDHWEEIGSLFSNIDGDILRFIISLNIPLEKFIRYELGARGYDKNGAWIGFEESKELWTKEGNN